MGRRGAGLPAAERAGAGGVGCAARGRGRGAGGAAAALSGGAARCRAVAVGADGACDVGVGRAAPVRLGGRRAGVRSDRLGGAAGDADAAAGPGERQGSASVGDRRAGVAAVAGSAGAVAPRIPHGGGGPARRARPGGLDALRGAATTAGGVGPVPLPVPGPGARPAVAGRGAVGAGCGEPKPRPQKRREATWGSEAPGWRKPKTWSGCG